MFNSFPQPKPDSGGWTSPLDWSAYQTVYDLTGATVSIPANTWQTFVNVTGKGFFKWCRVDGQAGSSNPSIRLTIDGVAYTFDTPNAGGDTQGNEVNFEIPFKNSLKIEGYNRHTSAVNFLCDYLYLFQQSTPSIGVTLLNQSQRKMAYLTGESTTLVDVVNVIGSGYLLGIHFLGYYGSTSGTVYGNIAIDGSNKMNRPLFQPATINFKQMNFPGPIRFDSRLIIQTRTTIAGAPYSCFAWYTLD